MAQHPDAPPGLPEGRPVELPGRGTTFVREVPGPPDAPVVVLLHGWTATAALNWFPTFGPLSQHFRVLALDQRGHGLGIRSRRPFRLEDCADDVAALAEELKITRLIPVGYSMGGPVAMLTWLRHRHLVEGVVLCATAARFGAGRPADRMFAQGILGLSLAANLSPASLRHRAMTRFVNNRLDGTHLSAWAAHELASNDPAALLRAGAALGMFDAGAWLPTIDIPTAVVVTEADLVVPPANQLALAEAIAGAEVFRVAGDHAVCAAGAARFVPVLVAACRRVAHRAATQAGAAGSAPIEPLPTT